jgi:hypothetical protein
MADDPYLTDPRANTVEGWIAIWEIIGRHIAKGKRVDCYAEHDIFYLPLQGVSEDSEDGQALTRLGLHYEDDTDSWAKNT